MNRLPETITIGQRQIEVGLTVADRLVNWFNPEAGRRRFEARAHLAMLGGYTAADKSRRANQLGGRRELSADSAIMPDLVTLREESQHLERNSPIAAGALKTNITKVVGTGLRVKAKIDRTVLRLEDAQANDWERSAEREFLLATETREIDIERELPFSLLQGLVFLRTLADGDTLVNLPHIRRPGSPYALKLQVIEAARICNPEGKADTETTIGGVTKDKHGAAVTYHVCSRHPGNLRFPMVSRDKCTWTDVTAFAQNGTPLALHLKDKTRPGQTRGVPYLAPVIELIKQLGRYTDAEVMAAVVSGMFTVLIHNDTGSPEFGTAPTQSNPTGDSSLQMDTTGIEMGYGSVIGVPGNTKVEFANPARPNTAFDPFLIAITRQIGMALELPFEVLLKHFTASYSAARAALIDAWDYFKRRRHWLVVQFCQPVYEAVITEAIVSGRLAAPGFLSDPMVRKAWLGTRWVGDAPGEIDPVKAIEAAKGRVELLLTTLEEEREAMIGSDHEIIQPQVVREHEWRQQHGLGAAVPATTLPVPPKKENDDADD